MKHLVRILLLLCLPVIAWCQDYNYSRYDIKDGLAGSTVYTATQDKDGFLWFGTETGLSRFDGTHFKNFFKKDGLPDNEVIKVYSDSRGRVWIAPFRKAVCYYYNGKIYNRTNDPILQQLQINEYIVRFIEDKDGNMLLQDLSCLHLVQTNGQVTKISEINGVPMQGLCSIGAAKQGGFLVGAGSMVYHLKDGHFTERNSVDISAIHFSQATFLGDQYAWRIKPFQLRTGITAAGIDLPFPKQLSINRIAEVSDTQVAVCTVRGAFLFNLRYPDRYDSFLPDKSITGVFADREGNYWFTTKGEGVYRLNSPFVKTLQTGMEQSSRQVFAVVRYRDWVLTGTDVNVIHKFDPATGKMVNPPIRTIDLGVEPIQFLLPLKDNGLICVTAQSLIHLSPELKQLTIAPYIHSKSVCAYSDDKILVATTRCVMMMRTSDLQVTDTIWKERGSAVLSSHDTIYIGTNDGLYCRLPDKKAIYLGDAFPVLSNRITALAKDANQVVWIATSGEGVVGYKNGKMIAHFVAERGLTSNLCRTLFTEGNVLWVGTDKGVNRINVAKPGSAIQTFTTGDGLISDVINAVYVDNNKVFVATPEGVTFFDKQKIMSESRCDLVFTDISIGGKAAQKWRKAPMVIPHRDNNVRFDYVGISFKSAGDVRYRYRLIGLDSSWRETRETFLSYPTLPSGNYELQLQAFNKFEVPSQLLSLQFSIEQLLWEKTWFRLIAGLLFLLLTGLLVYTIIRRVRKREEEKTAMNKRIGELEQLSRKAQMNPHFIFNSLNSIQQYVIESDISGANKFISGFSRLIRQTLDFSSRKDISLEEELAYLANYLELEKTRLEDAFTWELKVQGGIHPADYHIPPMLLQPFVENSVRHGLRFRKDKKGKVSIHIEKQAEALICVIEDNGIGRKMAMQLKSNSHIEYQSKGMSLTAERIAMWNKDHTTKITMRIEDVVDNVDNALGTRVTLTFPIL